jgi:hypothetical protein
VNSTTLTLAQHFNLSSPPIDEKFSIGMKYNRVLIKEESYLTSLSGIYKFYGIFPLKNNWQIHAEIPLVVANWKENDYSDNETGLANIFLEFQKALNQDRTTYLDFGIFIPTIASENYERMFVGILSDVYRFLQFMEGVTINSTFGYNLRNKPGAIFGVEFGPDLYIPTSDSGEDVEFLIHYGLKGGYNFQKISTWAEFSGMWILTEEGDIDTNSFNQIFIGGQLNSSKFRPGFFYGFHINKDFREETTGILGLNFQVVF